MSGTIAKKLVVWTGQDSVTPPAGSSERNGIAEELHVLIVEDHDASRHCLERVLQKEGYVVCSLPCAEDGLAEIEAAHVDILLTDLHLPGMDGFELIAKAKAVQPSIHILIMTADASKEARERARIVGADALMAKPLELDQLLVFLDSISLR
jgi:two-component system, NarL family, sensor histidine kinase EvgS